MTATLTPAPPVVSPITAAYGRRWYTLAVLCMSLLVIVVDSTIVNVALPTFSRDLHAGTSGLQWITDAYTLTFAALLLPAGAIADRYGRHRALAVGLAVFAAGSLAAALTRTTAELIATRAVMGTGAAFIMPATLSIITTVFTDHGERAKAIGIWSAISGLGVAIGPVAGGWLLAHFSWDSIFLVNLPLTAVALIAGHWLVPASRSPVARRLDPVGAAASVAAFTLLTWTLIDAPASGWLSGATLARFAAAGVLLAAFGVVEARSDHPMLPLHLFRDRRLAGAATALLLLFFALSGTVFLTTQIYQIVLGYSPLAAGLRALPPAVALAVAAPLGAHVAKRAGALVPVALGLALVTAGLCFFATATAASGYLHYVAAMVAVSAGIGMGMAAATSTTMQQLPPALAGVGSAVNDATRNMGSVLGVAVVGSIAATGHRFGGHGAALLHATTSAFVSGADHGVLAAAAVTLAGVVIALVTLRKARPF